MKIMISSRVILLFLIASTLTGCAAVVQKDLSKFNAASPHSILVVPVVNESLDVDAPDYFLSTISLPVAEQGYYVFPVNMVKRILEDEGLSDAGLVHNAPTEKLAQLFGSDSVLYITIRRWDAQYIVLTTTVTVELDYSIKDGKTGEELWRDHRIVKYQPSNSSSGNPLADLIVMAINAAVTKAAPNYVPLAQQANATTFTYPGPGVPPGPYRKTEESK